MDLPSPFDGHILFGIIPKKGKDKGGNTFVQSEMYGFQGVYNAYVGHGIGFIKSASGGGNRLTLGIGC